MQRGQTEVNQTKTFIFIKSSSKPKELASIDTLERKLKEKRFIAVTLKQGQKELWRNCGDMSTLQMLL